MVHVQEEVLVDIFDGEGTVIGQKKREEIEKDRDIVHTVYIFVFTPEKELWIATLSETATLYGGKFGSTAAGMVRHGEDALQAARRTLTYELGIESWAAVVLGTDVVTLSDGVVRMMSVVSLVYDGWVENRDGTVTEMKEVDRYNLEQLLNDRFLFAPSFLAVWERYQAKFPF